jgi:hypothetical protein
MALEMRGDCERCGARLNPEGVAFICSHECTFCAACARELQGVCPNCGGELVRRPTRKAAPAAGVAEVAATDAAPAAAWCAVGS